MNPAAKHDPKVSIEAKLSAIEDACEIAKVNNTQVDSDLMLVHVDEIREILIGLGVLGNSSMEVIPNN
jgi:MoaA/NifB/PqqE/SkfB family radical SAM enzyme